MKYRMDYLEFWATRHCNLNCRGCSSCSPLSAPWFLEPEQIKEDLLRLRKLNIEIYNITILGGEPLLHPDLIKIIKYVKGVYPAARIGLITNGLLLLQMNEQFWTTCSRYNVKFNVTCFPVMDKVTQKAIAEKCIKEKLEFHLTIKKKFNKILTQNHDNDIKEILKMCGCNKAYNLKDGKLSRCTVPMIVPILNEKFNAGMLEGGMIDIYSVHSGSEIIDYLNRPNKACKNCSPSPIKVMWEKAGECSQLKDWIIENEK